MTDGDRYDQGCRDTRAILMPEIERLRAALQYYASGIAGRGDIARHALGVNDAAPHKLSPEHAAAYHGDVDGDAEL